MSGSAGSYLAKKRRLEVSVSRKHSRSLKAECAGLVVGPVVLIVETSENQTVRKVLILLGGLYNVVMRIGNFYKLVVAIIISELAGIIGSVFTASSVSTWYAALEKPALNPPAWVFGPVWTILYALIGIALFLVWKNDWRVANHVLEAVGKPWNKWSRRLWSGDWQKQNVLAIFAVQYILNILWSFIFFGLQLPGLAFFALIALWFSIVYLIVNFYRISKAAAYLLLPYLLWVSFAGYLNFAIWSLN